MTRRVAVTGVGVVAPGGIGAKAFWSLLSAGRTATGPITLFNAENFRSRIAAECDFDARSEGLSPTQLRRLDRHIQFALVATREAVADAGLRVGEENAHRVGVTMGSAVGSTIRLEDEYVVASDGGHEWLVDSEHTLPFLYQALIPSSLAAEVAAEVGSAGPAMTVSTGCTSGLDSIGYAFQLIEDGAADVVIAGAADAPISPISVACFDAIRATSSRNDDPEHASRPFDASRDGFVIAEGSAVLVLEDLGRARARGAHIYCEVGGFATRGNAFHMTGLTREGLEMSAAIDEALRQARMDPTDIGYVNAHGSGTKQNDRHETAAIKRSLGAHAYQTPTSSIKSMVGHSLGAIGAIELVACVLAIQNSLLPPTANYETPDPECDLDYIPNVARERDVDAVLSVGSGFGGFQSAVVLDSRGRRA